MHWCENTTRVESVVPTRDEIDSIVSSANSAAEGLKALLNNLAKSSLTSMDIGLEHLLIQDSAANDLEVHDFSCTYCYFADSVQLLMKTLSSLLTLIPLW